MGSADYFLDGAWNFRCQECGMKLKSTEARRRWDNFIVGPECYEIRNPQDFVRGIPDNQSVPWSTGDPAPIWIDGNTTTQGAYPMVLNSWWLDGMYLG